MKDLLYKPKTLRNALTLWFISSVTAISFLFIAVLGIFNWFLLHDQIYHHLHTVISEANQIVTNYSGTDRENLLRNLVSGSGMTIILLDQNGNPVLETNSKDIASIGERQLRKIKDTGVNTTQYPVHFSVNSMYFAAQQLHTTPPQTLAIGYSGTLIENTYRNMVIIMSVGLLLFTVLFTYAIRRLLNHYLKPLESFADKAKNVSDFERLSTRFQTKGLTNEVQVIGDALNVLLSQMQTIFTSEHEFFSSAAHTLKTPLAVLRSQVEALKKESVATKQALLETIDTASDTVQDLLLISRVETEKNELDEIISVSQMLEEFKELAEVLGQEKHVHVVSTIEHDMYVKGNTRLLRRAIGNVIQNAVTYSRYNGELIIEGKQNKNKQIHIQIVDNGIGITKKELPYIFERFYRGSNTNNQKGSGLGLAITKAVLGKMHGTLTVTSELDKGTAINIYVIGIEKESYA